MRDLVTYIFISLCLLALLIFMLAILNMLFFSPWLFLYYQRKNKEMPKYVAWFIRKTNDQIVLMFIVTIMAYLNPVKNNLKNKNKYE